MKHRVRLGLAVSGVLLLVEGSPLLAQTSAAAKGLFRLMARPAMVLGQEDSGTTFDNVSAAVQLSDGRVIVADGGLRARLSLFAAEGQYITNLGSTGDGPGEFRWITSVQAGPGDSVFVFDAAAQRLTVLSGEGQVARTATLRVAAGVTGSDGLSGVARLDGGVWVGRGMESVVPGSPGALMRDTVVVGLLDGKLGDLRPLVHLPGRMTTTTLLSGSPVLRVPPFSPEVSVATWGNCTFVSPGDVSSVMVFGASGEMVGRFEGPGTRRAVRDEHLAQRLAQDVSTYGKDQEEVLRRVLYAEAHPTHLPYYHRLLVDHLGHLWMQEYAPPFGVGRRWFVVSQSGQSLGEVLMPKDIALFAVTEEGVLGRTTGDFGEHLVEVWSWSESPQRLAAPLPQCSAGGP